MTSVNQPSMDPRVDSMSSTSASTSASSSGTSTPALAQDDKFSMAPTVEEVNIDPPPPPIGDQDVQKQTLLSAREYQLEMFEESKNKNIIVAMDTGSGKTQVAVLRIQFELERSPDKIVWFLVPTVALCDQQTKVLRAQIPGAVIKILSGNDGIDTWTGLSMWNAFLKNADIVVSTYKVLQDALQHVFVSLDALSLIVFDEAHNCTKNHPGAKIMTVYYDKHKQAGLPLPRILGLTASPVMNTSANNLELLENTLDAVCRTPTKHRGELLTHVKRPTMVHVTYEPAKNSSPRTKAMASLSQAWFKVTDKIREDPFVRQKALERSERSLEDLERAMLKRDTPTIRQVASLYRKAERILEELGAWAADYFLRSAVTEYLNSVGKRDVNYTGWNIAEKEYLASALRDIELPNPEMGGEIPVSDKVTKLIQQLLISETNTQGIIFVKETAVVHVLQKILSLHHLTRDRFQVGVMVGTSRYALKKRDLGELIRNDGLVNLMGFRTGKLNFLIATSVLEEGIDVPACNLVISFDQPNDLRAFIQRRGRARRKESQLVLFWEDGNSMRTAWEKHEEEMKRKYEAEDREKQEMDRLEESEQSNIPPLRTEIGAELEFDAATSHLQHFCAVMASGQYVDWSPYYLIKRTHNASSRSEPPQIKATVVLPNSLPPHIHRTQSLHVWHTEKNARKDAAFQAYRKLYEAGLVNDHLLPLQDNDLAPDTGGRVPIIDVDERWNPWPRIAKAWSGPDRYHYPVRVTDQERVLHEFDMILPLPLPQIPKFDIYWEQAPWNVEINHAKMTATSASQGDGPDQTTALIKLSHGHRSVELREDTQHVVRFWSNDESITTESYGSRPFGVDLTSNLDGELPYLIRDGHAYRPYIFQEYLPSRPSPNLVRKKHSSSSQKFIEQHDTDGPWLALRPWPHRRNVLRKKIQGLPPQQEATRPYHTVWPVSCSLVDSTEISNVRFGCIIPSILHMMEVYLVAEELSRTPVLKKLHFRDLSLAVTAISASSAIERTDYQRLEFFGDVLLKLLSTISVAVNHPRFPEGYLTRKRVAMLSNSSLQRATLEARLDKFILTKTFTGRKWRPLYVDELLSTEEVSGKRKMSTKVLADIVESLAGAAFEDAPAGQKMDNALFCLRLLLPITEWHGLNEGRQALLLLKQPRDTLPPMLAPLEELIGYTFRNKTLLIEATTHVSYYGASASADQTLERLEFIGDAILDYVVVRALWAHRPPLPQHAMTALRAACVNADLLGLLAMERTVARPTGAVGPAGLPVAAQETFPLWAFMRHTHAEIGRVQRAAAARHARAAPALRAAMAADATYPWARLAALRPPKFFSDMVESLVGAIWMDSCPTAAAAANGDDYDGDRSGGGGDDPDGAAMRPCVAFVERLGVLPYLRRILDDGVDVFHPKNKVAQMADRDKVTYQVSMETGAAAAAGGEDVELVVPAPAASVGQPQQKLQQQQQNEGDHVAKEDRDAESDEEAEDDGEDEDEDEDDDEDDYDDGVGAEEQLHRELGEAIEAAVIAEEARLLGQNAARYTCRLFVGAELLVEMRGGAHKDEIITRTAEKACEILQQRKAEAARAGKPDSRGGG